jgi:hydrogenase nickel incorporation protein HypA/HybF
MHELSIAQALADQVEDTATTENASRVVRIVVVMGVLSGADPEAVRGAFSLVAEGTVAAGAELIIEQVAARVRCRACGHEAQTDAYFMGCAACGSRDVELVTGRELNIKSIELAVDER